ncbi:IucA/IucC family protein [Streptomyces sp. NPDC059166]|uniref:IucA/IucC family protein n=1 Tax=Streptomyces sp. NPDC059166 TaxID=3346752 RepID=UPI0036BA5D48
MNPTPAPDADGTRPGQQRGQEPPDGPLAVESTTVPRQKAGPHGIPRAGAEARAGAPVDPGPGPAWQEPLDHPDPLRAADHAGSENLLRCWTRENDLPRPAGDTLRIPLPASGTALLVPVIHWSRTGWHRFGAAVLENAPDGAPAADAATVAALLSREGGRDTGLDLVARVADSVRNTAVFLADRRRTPELPTETDRFLTAEQSLVLGHPLHPTPKSREGLSESETLLYSPELRGSFPLHWMAVDRSVLATDSSWTRAGRPVTAEALLAPHRQGLRIPEGTAAVPFHPWQATEVLRRPEVVALCEKRLLHDLGPYGEHWHPTSSVRTVHRPGSDLMLKLSLGVRITNSRRENLRKELHRGAEVHRLLRTGLAELWQTAHPGFDIVRDPAWLAVDHPDGGPVHGLDVILRHNPFRSPDDAVCIAGLTAPRPWPGRSGTHSRLAETVSSLAARTGRTTAAVCAEWFLRYLDRVVLPVLWLDAHAGVALEAHQQNTLVLLDADGWPAGGRYRDNQGYYFRESRRSSLERRLPGIGAVSDTFVSDAVTDERLAYYLGINNVFGLIGAFGAQRLADEQLLLAAFRGFLERAVPLGSSLPAYLLETDRLRCKANMLTRMHGLDELVGPVDTQSVYVTIDNPLHG